MRRLLLTATAVAAAALMASCGDIQGTLGDPYLGEPAEALPTPEGGDLPAAERAPAALPPDVMTSSGQGSQELGGGADPVDSPESEAQLVPFGAPIVVTCSWKDSAGQRHEQHVDATNRTDTVTIRDSVWVKTLARDFSPPFYCMPAGQQCVVSGDHDQNVECPASANPLLISHAAADLTATCRFSAQVVEDPKSGEKMELVGATLDLVYSNVDSATYFTASDVSYYQSLQCGIESSDPEPHTDRSSSNEGQPCNFRQVWTDYNVLEAFSAYHCTGETQYGTPVFKNPAFNPACVYNDPYFVDGTGVVPQCHCAANVPGHWLSGVCQPDA